MELFPHWLVFKESPIYAKEALGLVQDSGACFRSFKKAPESGLLDLILARTQLQMHRQNMGNALPGSADCRGWSKASFRAIWPPLLIFSVRNPWVPGSSLKTTIAPTDHKLLLNTLQLASNQHLYFIYAYDSHLCSTSMSALSILVAKCKKINFTNQSNKLDFLKNKELNTRITEKLTLMLPMQDGSEVLKTFEKRI